jgi:selenide, water dikinase
VDDPWRFGMIAANHALGDIYAMGGEPHTALAIATIPYGLEAKVEADLSAMMEGANAVLREAGCALVGGHTSEGAELALGFAVNGLVAREAFLRKGGLRPNDALVLTKPIGTGVLTTAVKRNAAPESVLAEAIRSMTTLNRDAAEAMNAAGATAATDITGFGLLGHLGNMLRAASKEAGTPIGARLSYAAVPVFDRVTGFLKDGLCPGGTRRNLEYAAPNARFADSLTEPQRLLLADAQTSGGLLIAVPQDKLAGLVVDLKKRGTLAAAVIGSVVAADKPGVIEVTA